jgi:hypothetical protein
MMKNDKKKWKKMIKNDKTNDTWPEMIKNEDDKINEKKRWM